MEPIFILIALWVIFGPLMGLVALYKHNGLRRDLRVAQAEIRSLRRAQNSGETAMPSQSTVTARSEITSVPPTHRRQTPRASSQSAQSGRKSQAAPKRDWERLIAANWMVWTGGLALAIGGLFLVRIALDAGLFGPAARTFAASALGVGLIAAGFRARGNPTVLQAQTAVQFLPQILSAAGLVSLYGAAIACGLIYQFLSPIIALLLLVAVSVLAIGLALIFGQVLAISGIIGAYIAPLLTGSEGGSVLPLLAYFAVITAVSLALIQLRHWRHLIWISTAFSGFWGWVASMDSAPYMPHAVSAYALVLAALALFIGSSDAAKQIPLPKRPYRIRLWFRSVTACLLTAHLFWILAGALLFIVGLRDATGLIVPAALASYGGIGLFVSWRRVGYAAITPFAGAITLLCLSIWALTAPPLLYACLASALGFGLAGYGVMQIRSLKTPFAMVGALVPPGALFIGFWRESGFIPDFRWGLVALFMALIFASIVEQFRRRDALFSEHAGAVACYALGALLSLALAPFLLFSGYWLGTAMAIVALMIAVILQRFDLDLVRYGGFAAITLAIGLLVRPGLVDPGSLSPTPLANTMTAGFGLGIAALYLGARLTRRFPQLRQAYEAGALILGFTLVALTIRHVSGEGRLEGAYGGIGEASAYAIAYLGMAASFAWRLSRASWWWRTAEYIALAIGTIGLLTVLTSIGRGSVGQLPVINLLLVGIAMPAIIVAAYGYGLYRAGRLRLASLARLAAMILGFVWISLEVARTFGGDRLETLYGDFGWAYSPAWISYAFLLLFWGVLRRRRAPRYMSLAILLLAIAKVFLLDMDALEGAARAASFIGLGLSLIGIALFYQRYVFQVDEQANVPRSQEAPG